MGSGARREPASLRTDIPTCTDEGSLLRFHTWKRLDLAGAASIATLGVAILAALNARRAYQRQDRLFAHNVRSSTQQEDSGQFRLPPAESIDAAHKFSRGRFWWGLVSTTILSLFCTAILWAEGWPQSAPRRQNRQVFEQRDRLGRPRDIADIFFGSPRFDRYHYHLGELRDSKPQRNRSGRNKLLECGANGIFGGIVDGCIHGFFGGLALNDRSAQAGHRRRCAIDTRCVRLLGADCIDQA